MPTPTEILKPWMKYCKKQDVHCSCLTCNALEICLNKTEICDYTLCDICDADEDQDHRKIKSLGCYKPKKDV